MARIVRHTEQGPFRLPLADIKTDLYLCRCGLSQNGVFCDGSHKATRDEKPGLTYQYHREEGTGILRRAEVDAAPAAPQVAVAAQEVGGAA